MGGRRTETPASKAGAERLAPLGAKARRRACDMAAPAAGVPDGVHLLGFPQK